MDGFRPAPGRGSAAHVRGRFQSRRAFTLIEALAASVILLIAVTAVCWAVTLGNLNSHRAQTRIMASMAIDYTLADARSRPFSQLYQLPPFTTPDEWGYPFTRMVVVDPALPYSGPNGVTISTTSLDISILDSNGREVLHHTAVFTDPDPP